MRLSRRVLVTVRVRAWCVVAPLRLALTTQRGPVSSPVRLPAAVRDVHEPERKTHDRPSTTADPSRLPPSHDVMVVPEHGVDTTGEVQLSIDIGEVPFHAPLRYAEFAGDLFRWEPACEDC